jgi:hypothetical protein
MSTQANTQEVIERLAAIFQPQLTDIKEQLNDLVTRREHEKDLTEVNADMASHQRQIDRLQQWADARPRQSADVEWVRRIESDVREVEGRLAKAPAETRAWMNTAFSGGGCVYMIVGLIVVVVMQLMSIGASVLIALALRGGG